MVNLFHNQAFSVGDNFLILMTLMLDSEVILYVRSVASHSLGEQELNKLCKVYGQYTLN